MPKIDESNIADSLSKIKDMSKSVAEGKKTWQDLFDTLPEGEKHLAKLGKEMEGQIITEEGLINANKKARESAIAHNNALKQQTLGAKAATVATKALSVALNMVAMWAITKTPNNCSAKNIDKILIIFEVRSIVNYNYFWRMVIYGILFF